MKATQSSEVAAAFDAFAPESRELLLDVRSLIFDIAGEIEDVQSIEESLKWGQPSYATRPKTGTPIRLGQADGAPAIFVHCQTTLVADLAADNPYGLRTIDNRAVVIPERIETLSAFLKAALTYARRD